MEETKLSEWNMAKATLMRMDACLQNCNHYDRNHEGIDWFRELKLLYKEVYPEIKKEEREEIEMKMNEAITAFNILMEFPEDNRPKITPTLREKLEELEMLIRDVMGKHKLYMAREKSWKDSL